MWESDHKESQTLKNSCFLWCWRRLLRVPWTARSNQSILKEINPEYPLEGLMLKLKHQYFGYLIQRADLLKKKDPDAGKDWIHEEKGMAENKMVGWNQWFNRHEFEQALGNGGGQESLVCCNPWGHKELDTTEQLDNNILNEEKPPTCIAHMWGVCREMLQLVSRHLFIQNLLRAYYVPKVLLSGTHKEWDRDLYTRVWELPMGLWGCCSPRDPHWDMRGAQHLSSP